MNNIIWKYNDEFRYYSAKSQSTDSYNTNIENPKKLKALALFNFYGTIAWNQKGILRSYNNRELIPASPFIEITLCNLILKGYTPCIIEFCSSKNSHKLKKCIESFCIKNNLNTHILIINSEISNLPDIILNYFIPDLTIFSKQISEGKDFKIFHSQSFYCGNRIDEFHSFPWFRSSNTDTKIASSLGLKFYDPLQVFGFFDLSKFLLLSYDVVITCGQEYSGFDLLYESETNEILHKNTICRHKIFNGENIYFILSENLESEIIIDSKEHYIIIGSNPTKKERSNIASKFIKENIVSLVGWFCRYPYEITENYNSFIQKFEIPIKETENWLRIN